jgi:hypothetical protein
VKLCQKYGILWSFAENMELCEVLPKNMIISNFAKNIELCLNLSNLWSYAKFCQKYGIM